MRKKLFIVGILGMALVFGIPIIGCDNGTTGDNTDPKTLVITNVDGKMAAQGMQSGIGIGIGIFPKGTTWDQAFDPINIVAGANNNSIDLSGGPITYTVTAQLYSAASGFDKRWIGSGTYDVFIELGNDYYLKKMFPLHQLQQDLALWTLMKMGMGMMMIMETALLLHSIFIVMQNLWNTIMISFHRRLVLF